MGQYRFTALVTLDPAAREYAARCGQSAAQACCLLEPSRYTYFPAVIETQDEQPQQAVPHVLMTTTLYDSEARTFFAPGQRFRIWADALVGHTIRADGLIGYGIICQCVALPARHAHRDRASGSDAAGVAAVSATPGP